MFAEATSFFPGLQDVCLQLLAIYAHSGRGFFIVAEKWPGMRYARLARFYSERESACLHLIYVEYAPPGLCTSRKLFCQQIFGDFAPSYVQNATQISISEILHGLNCRRGIDPVSVWRVGRSMESGRRAGSEREHDIAIIGSALSAPPAAEAIDREGESDAKASEHN